MTARSPLPAKVEPQQFTAIVDSREQHPLDLSPLRTEVAGLTTGDYSIKVLEDHIAVERKSLDDLIACRGHDRARFDKEVQRLLAFPCRALVILLPGGSVTISECAAELGKLIAAKQIHFRHGDGVSRLDGRQLRQVTDDPLCSDFEKVARLWKWMVTKDSVDKVPTICSKSVASRIVASEDFVQALPKLDLLSPCPVLVERPNGSALTVKASRVACRFFFHTCHRHYPGGTNRVMSLVTRPAAAFPIGRAGRLPYCAFRGLLSVHSRYGLRAC